MRVFGALYNAYRRFDRYGFRSHRKSSASVLGGAVTGVPSAQGAGGSRKNLATSYDISSTRITCPGGVQVLQENGAPYVGSMPPYATMPRHCHPQQGHMRSNRRSFLPTRAEELLSLSLTVCGFVREPENRLAVGLVHHRPPNGL